MLRLSKLTDYASVVMSEMARDPGQRFSATELSARLHIEPPTVSKVLKELAKQSLVRSFRGVRGGYELVRAPEEISMLDIIEAMEGPVGVTECAAHGSHCGHEAICAIRGNWRQVNEVLRQALDEMSLARMSQPEHCQHASKDSVPISANG